MQAQTRHSADGQAYTHVRVLPSSGLVCLEDSIVGQPLSVQSRS